MKLKYGLVSILITVAALTAIYGANKSSAAVDPDSREILIRTIGHELLLSAGDQHSRVLPVKKINNHRYTLLFENDLTLDHSQIIRITGTVFSGREENYKVDVLNCEARETVYSFLIRKSAEESLVPCAGRALPKSCYMLDISFEEKAGNNTIWYLLAAAGLAAIIGLWFYSRKKKPAPPEAEEDNVDSPGHIIPIGQYLFDKNTGQLEMEGHSDTLTQKEAKILELLAASINNLIPRATLQKEVWENDGVIVTRSLDMYISRLRKKLAMDPNVKIVSVPARGYKLEVLS
jgi:LPXTG-motif cell wall-anchored protein